MFPGNPFNLIKTQPYSSVYNAVCILCFQTYKILVGILYWKYYFKILSWINLQ